MNSQVVMRVENAENQQATKNKTSLKETTTKNQGPIMSEESPKNARKGIATALETKRRTLMPLRDG